MYAIIKTGGKQYKVRENNIIKIEKLKYGVGDTITFDKVLLVANDEINKVGAPFIEGAKVLGDVVDQKRAPKVRIIKFRRRKNSMKRQGHRQYYTAVKINKIEI